MAAHHDDIPSISSRPSASRSRVPSAATTGTGGRTDGIAAYGCHTTAWSRATRSPQLAVPDTEPACQPVATGDQPVVLASFGRGLPNRTTQDSGGGDRGGGSEAGDDRLQDGVAELGGDL